MIKGCSKMDDEDNEKKKKRLKEMDDNDVSRTNYLLKVFSPDYQLGL